VPFPKKNSRLRELVPFPNNHAYQTRAPPRDTAAELALFPKLADSISKTGRSETIFTGKGTSFTRAELG